MKFVHVTVQGACFCAIVLLALSCGEERGSYGGSAASRNDWRESSDLASGRRFNPDDMAMQVRLGDMGYNPGPIDGVMGPRTRSALQKYQRDNGLLPSGFPGPATRACLFPASVRLTGGFQQAGRYGNRCRRVPIGPRYPGDIGHLIGTDDGYGLTPAGGTGDNFYRILRPANGHVRSGDDPER